MYALKAIDIDNQAEFEFNREKSNRLFKQVFEILADGAIKFSWKDAEQKTDSDVDEFLQNGKGVTMSVLIGSWEFEGPFSATHELRPEPGIVALLTNSDDEFELVAIDESDSVQEYLEHQKKSVPHNSDKLSTAVYYCSDLNSTLRRGLVDELMKEFECDDYEYDAYLTA